MNKEIDKIITIFFKVVAGILVLYALYVVVQSVF